MSLDLQIVTGLPGCGSSSRLLMPCWNTAKVINLLPNQWISSPAKSQCLQSYVTHPFITLWPQTSPRLQYFTSVLGLCVLHLLPTRFLSPYLFPESFTADHKPLMGEAPEVRGFFLGCGFNSAGTCCRGRKIKRRRGSGEKKEDRTKRIKGRGNKECMMVDGGV